MRINRFGGNNHTFQDSMRIGLQYTSIHESAWIAFIGIT
jgi:hypothetical protein